MGTNLVYICRVFYAILEYQFLILSWHLWFFGKNEKNQEIFNG